jgi:hypothetical protein
MRRLVAAFVFLGLVVAIPALALAAKGDGPQNPPKVIIAHLADQVDQIDDVTGEVLGTTYYYNVIEVSEKAVDTHVEHGDVLEGGTLPDGTIFSGAKGDKLEIFVPAAIPE